MTGRKTRDPTAVLLIVPVDPRRTLRSCRGLNWTKAVVESLGLVLAVGGGRERDAPTTASSFGKYDGLTRATGSETTAMALELI